MAKPLSPSPRNSALVGSQVSLNPGELNCLPMPARIWSRPTNGSAESSTALGAMNSLHPSTPRSAVALAKARSASIKTLGSRSAANDATLKARKRESKSGFMTPPTGQGSLMQFAEIRHRPVAEDRLAVNESLVHGPEVATVVGEIAMIAEDKIGVRRNDDLGKRPHVFVGRRHIIFGGNLSVDVHQPVIDADAIAGQSNDTLDVALRGVSGVVEDDDVAAVNGLQPIDELVNEHSLLVGKSGHHAGAFDLYGLVEEDNEEHRNGERNEDITKPP